MIRKENLLDRRRQLCQDMGRMAWPDEAWAAREHIPPDALASRLIRDALPSDVLSFMNPETPEAPKPQEPEPPEARKPSEPRKKKRNQPDTYRPPIKSQPELIKQIDDMLANGSGL